ARDGKLTGNDLQGGTFTISSLGGIGGTSFTPIINAPEVAILGVVRSRTTPVWNGESFQPRMLLPVSLSYDHRVVDGALAARFARQHIPAPADGTDPARPGERTLTSRSPSPTSATSPTYPSSRST